MLPPTSCTYISNMAQRRFALPSRPSPCCRPRQARGNHARYAARCLGLRLRAPPRPPPAASSPSQQLAQIPPPRVGSPQACRAAGSARCSANDVERPRDRATPLARDSGSAGSVMGPAGRIRLLNAPDRRAAHRAGRRAHCRAGRATTGRAACRRAERCRPVQALCRARACSGERAVHREAADQPRQLLQEVNAAAARRC